ncbi:MAG: hypothetical protein U9O94_00700 [Nanoarchaeota archaeon]|nr:hypothetical protein [Nanoarchaeota archaeon]
MAIEQSQGRKVLGKGFRENIGLAGAGGQQMITAGQRMVAFAEEEERIEEKTKVAEGNDYLSTIGTDLTLKHTQGYLDYKKENADNPSKTIGTYLESIEEDYDEAILNAPNEKAVEALEKQKLATIEGYGKQGITWQHNQAMKNQINNLNDSTAKLQNASMSLTSPEQLIPLLIQNEANFRSANEHLDEQQIKEGLKKSNGALYNSFLTNRLITNPMEVYNGLDSGMYDEILEPSQKQQLLYQSSKNALALSKEAVEEQGKANNVNVMEDILSGSSDRRLTYKSKEDRQIGEDHLEEIGFKERYSDGDPIALETVRQYAKRVGFLPDTMTGLISSSLNSGTPEQRAFSAETIGIINETNPVMLNRFDRTAKQKAILVNKLIRAGKSAEDAWENVDFQFDTSNKEIATGRANDFKKLKEDYGSFDKAVGGMFEKSYLEKVGTSLNLVIEALPMGMFTDETVGEAYEKTKEHRLPIDQNIYDALKEEYNTLWKANYIESGNMETAREATDSEFKSTIGMTNISGKPTIMKYPVEKFYSARNSKGVIIGGDWQQRQLLAFAKKATGRDDIKSEDIALVSDPRTARLVKSALPDWGVVVTIDGRPVPLGKKVRFAPNPDVITNKYNEEDIQAKVRDREIHTNLEEREKEEKKRTRFLERKIWRINVISQ